MYIPFQQLSDKARIWIYQASRPFKNDEQTKIHAKAQAFLEQWTTHGRPLQCSATLFYDQFLVLAVEESYQRVTDCAVDTSVYFVRELESLCAIDLLQRTQIAFRIGAHNIIVPINQLQEQIQTGTISGGTLTFDNTITTKGALANEWLVRAEDTWLKRYFTKP